MEQEIVDYILQAQKHGLSEQEIKQNLLDAGWDADTVEQSLIFARAADTHSSASGAPPFLVSYPNPQRSDLGRQPAAFQNTHSAITISEQHFQKSSEPGKQGFFRRPAFWVSVLVLILLAGGAYAYYSLVFANPAKIWQKFSQGAAGQTAYQTKFNFSYSDPGQFDSGTSSLISFQFKDIKLTFDGSGYINAQNKDNPESNSKIQYTFSSGNTSFSTGLEYILQNKVLYLNVGNNPILDLISQGANGGQKIDWIKIDLNGLNKEASSSPSDAKFFQQLTSPDFKNNLQKIWENTTVIKEDSYVGREKINGVYTLHFKNSIDKQALKSLINQYVKELAKAFKGTSSELSDSDIATANQITAQLIDKIQIKEFETWVGMTDFKLYRVHLMTNAPSFISLVKNASSFNAPASNDAKRVSDMRQMAAALEMYYNDHNGYPEGKNGQAVELTPAYIGLIPTSPAPNGNCSDWFNTYWYMHMGQKTTNQGKTVYSSYQITFCLGSSAGGYLAGFGKLTPSGISVNAACPGAPEHCVKSANAIDSNEEVKRQITDFINKLDFSAQVLADADYTDYGKIIPVTPPAKSFDILQKYQATQSMATDAKRLADIRQIATALELYFNDKNTYPSSLNQLAPTYISIIPVPPSASGTCSEQDNAYTYTKIASGKYKLTFCLGQATGGYSGGKHTLSEAGIQ